MCVSCFFYIGGIFKGRSLRNVLFMMSIKMHFDVKIVSFRKMDSFVQRMTLVNYECLF